MSSRSKSPAAKRGRSTSRSPRRQSRSSTPSGQKTTAAAHECALVPIHLTPLTPRPDSPAAHLSSRDDLHLTRKLFHALNGSALSYVYDTYLDQQQMLLLVAGLWLLLFAMETLRFSSSFVQGLAVRMMGSIMRKNELQQYSGARLGLRFRATTNCARLWDKE